MTAPQLCSARHLALTAPLQGSSRSATQSPTDATLGCFTNLNRGVVHMSNVAGATHSFQYRHWSGQLWTASLQDIVQQEVLGVPTGGVIDPDFEHVGPSPGTNSHEDQWIEYITGDGTLWHSKCHAHTGGRVTFSFEHFPKDSDDSHEDGRMEFLDWDGKVWELTIPDMNPPGGNPEKVMVLLSPGPPYSGK
jgi:hypothetical protein